MKLRIAAVAGLLAWGCSPAPSGGPIAPIIVESPPDAGVAAPPIVIEDAPPPAPVESAIGLADKTLRGWTKRSLCPSSYDYFPEGGIQSFWCHRPEALGLASVREAAGGRIFASGPHSADDLVLDARFDFGRYDPAFVKWLGEQVPAKSTPETQAIYDRFMKPLARIFWTVLAKTKSDKACFDREKSLYADLIKQKKLPAAYYERWFYFMNPAFCTRPPKGMNDSYLMNNGFDGGVDGNVTKTVVGFWLRRSIDGTYAGFAEGLERFMKVFDPAAQSGKIAPPKRKSPDPGF